VVALHDVRLGENSLGRASDRVTRVILDLGGFEAPLSWAGIVVGTVRLVSPRVESLSAPGPRLRSSWVGAPMPTPGDV
jgi:hypothetical protein